MFLLLQPEVLGQVAQVAKCLVTRWMVQVLRGGDVSTSPPRVCGPGFSCSKMSQSSDSKGEGCVL